MDSLNASVLLLAYSSRADRAGDLCAGTSARSLAHRCLHEDAFPSELQAIAPALLLSVRPAGRTHLEVEVLYSPGKGKS